VTAGLLPPPGTCTRGAERTAHGRRAPDNTAYADLPGTAAQPGARDAAQNDLLVEPPAVSEPPGSGPERSTEVAPWGRLERPWQAAGGI
jgi:hypothetical protein